MMPKWEPGKQNGRAVSVYTTIPINFAINDTAIEHLTPNTDSVFTLPRTGFSLEDYLFWNLRYPEKLMSRKIGGIINFEFTIDTSGSVINFNVLKTSDTAINTAVKRMLDNMPKWKPGSANGQAVCMTLSQEITYTVSRKADLSRQGGGVEYGIKCDRKWTIPKYVKYEISCQK
jgi:TonB family protein